MQELSAPQKRIERKKDEDNEINGRRRKMPQQKNGICQVLYLHETQRPTRINKYELDNEIRINQWSDGCEDRAKWKPEIYQTSRRRSRSQRTNAKMAVKKFIATTLSSREKGMRRRKEGWTEKSKDNHDTEKPQQRKMHE